MNTYATLDQLKESLSITATTDDALLLRLLKAASRWVDTFCNRHFYAKTETKYLDGSNGLDFLIPDCLLLSEVKWDKDLDYSYEETHTEDTDFYLRPDNEFPKWEYIEAPDATYGVSYGKRMAKLTGLWGYGDGESATPYTATSITGTVADASGTTLTLSAEGTIEAGHTILVESEQMWVSAVTSDGSKEATVTRGVNGTTAAAHSAKTLSTYDYPFDVQNACMFYASELYNERNNPGMQSERIGDYSYTKAAMSNIRCTAVERALLPYRKVPA